MKNYILLCISLITIIQSDAQVYKTTIFDEKVVEKLEYYFDSHGFNTKTLLIKDSLPDGDYLIYTDSLLKMLVCEGSYKNQKKTGNWFYYHINGKISEHLFYKGGLLSGKYKSFTYAGLPMQSVLIVNNFKEGIEYTYNNDYSMFYDIKNGGTGFKTYKNGFLEGEQIAYNIDSTKITYTAYKKNIIINRITTEYADTISRIEGKKYNRLKPSKGIAFSVFLNAQKNEKSSLIEELNKLKLYKKIHRLIISFHSNSPEKNKLISNAISSLPTDTKIYELSISTDSGVHIPSYFFKFKSIKKLTLLDFDKLPKDIASLKNLNTLRLSNKKKGNIILSNEIISLQKLKTIICNKPTKRDIAILSKLPSLRFLVLNDSYIDSIPDIFYGLNQLEGLFLGGYYSYSGPQMSLPPSIFTLKSLRCLELSWHRISKNDQQLFSQKLPLCKRVEYNICLVGSSQIRIDPSNLQQLSSFQSGEIISAYDTTKKILDTASILKVHHHTLKDVEMLCLYFKSSNVIDSIITTPNHLFMDNNNKWRAATELKSGNRLTYFSKDTNTRTTATITKIKPVIYPLIDVFNLKTTLGTYIANGLIVHNK